MGVGTGNLTTEISLKNLKSNFISSNNKINYGTIRINATTENCNLHVTHFVKGF